MTRTDLITGDAFQSLASVSWAPPQEAIKYPKRHAWNPIIFSQQRGARLLQAVPAQVDKLKDHRIIFVYGAYVYDFLRVVLPLMGHKFIMIVHNSDVEITKEIFEYLDSPLIVHIYAQNCRVEHPKLTPIPIGVANDCGPWDRHDALIRAMADAKPWSERMSLIYANYGETCPSRVVLNRRLQSRGGIVRGDHSQSLESYYREMSCYQYVLSPPGAGPDCFRTWEALYIGCLPIVERWPVGSPYCRMVIERDDLGSVGTGQNAIYAEDRTSKLHFSYWSNIIRSKALHYFPFLVQKSACTKQ